MMLASRLGAAETSTGGLAMGRGYRLVATGAVAVVLAACLCASASAAKPVRTFLPYGGLPPEGITISGICLFPVQLTPTLGNEHLKEFGNGRSLITGRTQGTLTNLVTGRSIRINVPLAAHQTLAEDGVLTVRVTGRVLIWFFPGELGPGSPGFIRIYSGQEILRLDASGNTLSFTQIGGTSRDVCALLAG
jgi:hypothetical protein